MKGCFPPDVIESGKVARQVEVLPAGVLRARAVSERHEELDRLPAEADTLSTVSGCFVIFGLNQIGTRV